MIVGSLKGKSIYRIRRTNDKILSLEKIYIGSRIRSIAQLNKKIIVLTDSGQLLFITVDLEKLNSNSRKYEKIYNKQQPLN